MTKHYKFKTHSQESALNINISYIARKGKTTKFINELNNTTLKKGETEKQHQHWFCVFLPL